MNSKIVLNVLDNIWNWILGIVIELWWHMKSSIVWTSKMVSKNTPNLWTKNRYQSYEYSASQADKLSLTINVLLALHTSAYDKMKQSKAFTPIFVSIILPLFLLNSTLYLNAYLAKERIFWNFSLFWIGTIMSYTAFFAFQSFWLYGNVVIVSAMMLFYFIVTIRRQLMHYVYNFGTSGRNLYDPAIGTGNSLVIRSSSLQYSTSDVEIKPQLWWDLKFRILKYKVDFAKHEVVVDPSSFAMAFEENNYDIIVAGNFISIFTEKNYRINTVTRVENKVIIMYEEGDHTKKGDCYYNLERLNLLEKVNFEYKGCMNISNHVEEKGFRDSVYKFKFAMYFNQGWYKKELSEIKPSRNTCRPLEPLNYNERILEKNIFIKTLKESGNTSRLSTYLEQCINWYHNKPYKKVATLEYRKRWINHRNWILGSPIVEERSEDKIVIKITEVYEKKKVLKTVEQIIDFTHAPIYNPGETKEMIVDLIPNSYSTPPPVVGNVGGRDVYVPAPGYKLKDYKSKVTRLCTCGKVKDFVIEEHERRFCKETGITFFNNLVKKEEPYKTNVEVTKEEVHKVREAKSIIVKKQAADSIIKAIKVKDVFPNILSEKVKKFTIPKIRSERNILLNKERQKCKAARKEAIKYNGKIIDMKVSPYSRKKRSLKILRPGKEVVEKKIIIRKVDPSDLESLLNKKLELNGFPKCKVGVLTNLLKPIPELKKMFRVSRKQIKFLRSIVSYEHSKEYLN